MRYDTKWPWVSKYVIVQLPTKIRIVCPFTLLTHLHCQLSASNSDAASPTYASQTQLTMRFLPATHPLTWYTSCRKAMTPNWGGGVAHTIEHRQCQRNGEDPPCTLDLEGFFAFEFHDSLQSKGSHFLTPHPPIDAANPNSIAWPSEMWGRSLFVQLGHQEVREVSSPLPVLIIDYVGIVTHISFPSPSNWCSNSQTQLRHLLSCRNALYFVKNGHQEAKKVEFLAICFVVSFWRCPYSHFFLT